MATYEHVHVVCLKAICTWECRRGIMLCAKFGRVHINAGNFSYNMYDKCFHLLVEN